MVIEQTRRFTTPEQASRATKLKNARNLNN
jgi:hypothetical protein